MNESLLYVHSFFFFFFLAITEEYIDYAHEKFEAKIIKEVRTHPTYVTMLRTI